MDIKHRSLNSSRVVKCGLNQQHCKSELSRLEKFTSNLKLQYILLETRPQIWNPSTLYSEITIGNSTSNLKLQYIVLETRPQIWNPSPLILLEIPLLRLDGVKYQSNVPGFVATGRKSMDMIHRSLNSSRVVKYGLNQSWASILS